MVQVIAVFCDAVAQRLIEADLLKRIGGIIDLREGGTAPAFRLWPGRRWPAGGRRAARRKWAMPRASNAPPNMAASGPPARGVGWPVLSQFAGRRNAGRRGLMRGRRRRIFPGDGALQVSCAESGRACCSGNCGVGRPLRARNCSSSPKGSSSWRNSPKAGTRARLPLRWSGRLCPRNTCIAATSPGARRRISRAARCRCSGSLRALSKRRQAPRFWLSVRRYRASCWRAPARSPRRNACSAPVSACRSASISFPCSSHRSVYGVRGQGA